MGWDIVMRCDMRTCVQQDTLCERCAAAELH